MESFENPQGAAPPVEPATRSRKTSAKTAGATSAKAKTPRVRKPATSARVRRAAKPERPSSDALAGMIATAAYFRAVERNFAPGHELEDWLAAERKILALYQ